MRYASISAGVCLFVLLGCAERQPSPEHPGAQPLSENAATPVARRDSAAAAASPASIFSVHGREDGRAVKLWVVNESDTAVRLRRAVRIERRVGVDWQAVDVSAVWLREDCRPRDGILFWQGGEDECVDIAARRTFESIGWMGMIGDAQCACEECGRAPRGEYRFLVTTCAGAVQASEPFALTGR